MDDAYMRVLPHICWCSRIYEGIATFTWMLPHICGCCHIYVDVATYMWMLPHICGCCHIYVDVLEQQTCSNFSKYVIVHLCCCPEDVFVAVHDYPDLSNAGTRVGHKHLVASCQDLARQHPDVFEVVQDDVADVAIENVIAQPRVKRAVGDRK